VVKHEIMLAFDCELGAAGSTILYEGFETRGDEVGRLEDGRFVVVHREWPRDPAKPERGVVRVVSEEDGKRRRSGRGGAQIWSCPPCGCTRIEAYAGRCARIDEDFVPRKVWDPELAKTCGGGVYDGPEAHRELVHTDATLNACMRARLSRNETIAELAKDRARLVVELVRLREREPFSGLVVAVAVKCQACGGKRVEPNRSAGLTDLVCNDCGHKQTRPLIGATT
jgi:hypothetical protein